MKLQIRLVVIADNEPEQVHEIASLQRTELKLETLGMTLAEGKTILREIQRVVVERQVAECLEPYQHCSACGQPQRGKGQHDLSMRTVFGKMAIPSPRIVYCDCQPHETKSFSPLTQLLPERTTPEMLFLETKWSALMSYGVTADLLQEVLPMDSPLHASTIREHVFRVAERMERELGEEQCCFIEGCERDWNQLPPPDGPLTVGIDGGYVRGRNKEHFEVIAGKSLLAFRREAGEEEELSNKCFAFVQTYDEKPKRRLLEMLRSQGLQMNQQVEFLSDGGEDVRNVQLYLHPEAEHLLDWFHITMRLTVMNQMAKGVPETVGKDGDQYEFAPQFAEKSRIAEMVSQCVPSVENVGRTADGCRERGLRDQKRNSSETAEADRRPADLCRAQSGVHSELWRALSQRRTNRIRFCGVSRESGGEQTNGETPTNAVDTTRRSPAATDTYARAE